MNILIFLFSILTEKKIVQTFCSAAFLSITKIVLEGELLKVNKISNLFEILIFIIFYFKFNKNNE